MQLWQYCLLVTARSLYTFRTLPATTVFSTPDDGRRKRPKTCRVILQWLINNTAKVSPVGSLYNIDHRLFHVTFLISRPREELLQSAKPDPCHHATPPTDGQFSSVSNSRSLKIYFEHPVPTKHTSLMRHTKSLFFCFCKCHFSVQFYKRAATQFPYTVMGKNTRNVRALTWFFPINCISSLLMTTQSQQLVLKPQVITLTLNIRKLHEHTKNH